jgi:signal transduction histidine kinase
MASLVLVIISMTLFGLWADRALSAPLSSFAKAAETFSLDGSDAPLLESSPYEIRALARALNRSRARITALIDDRTKMLAAISHDLRTPITRLRLRCEFIEDVPHRTNMLRDLNQMHSMLEAVLSFLRNGRKLESMTLIDLASTLQLVTDQFADMGHNVRYDGPEHAMATARPDDINRAVTNLVENAVRSAPRRRSGCACRRRRSSSKSRTTARGLPTPARTACCSPSCVATTPATWTRPPASASDCRSHAPSYKPMAAN